MIPPKKEEYDTAQTGNDVFFVINVRLRLSTKKGVPLYSNLCKP